MNLLQDRPRTIEEIYLNTPTVLKIHTPLILNNATQKEGGIFKTATIKPLSHPDMAKRVLFQRTIIQEVTNFIYKNRYPFLAIGIGSLFLIAGLEYMTAAANEKEKRQTCKCIH